MPTVEEYTHLPEWVVGHSLKCSVHIVTVHQWEKGLRCHRCAATRTKKVRVSAFSSSFGSLYLGKKSNRRWGDQQHTFNIKKWLCIYNRRQIYTLEKVRKCFTCFVQVHWSELRFHNEVCFYHENKQMHINVHCKRLRQLAQGFYNKITLIESIDFSGIPSRTLFFWLSNGRIVAPTVFMKNFLFGHENTESADVSVSGLLAFTTKNEALKT